MSALTIEERRRQGAELVSAGLAGSGAPLPSPPARDLFPGNALPSVSASELTADHLASGLLGHGAIFVSGLLPPDRVAELRTFLDTGPARITGGRGDGDQSGMLNSMVSAYEACGVLDLAQCYVGETPVGMAGRTVLKREVPPAGIPWHQDASFMGRKLGSLNVWTALTPCGEDRPGLAVVPRRFDEILEPGYEFGQPTSERLTALIEEFRRDPGIAAPCFSPGDALLFDEMTLHRTSFREWRVPSRDVAVTWFFAPSRFPTGGARPLAF